MVVAGAVRQGLDGMTVDASESDVVDCSSHGLTMGRWYGTNRLGMCDRARGAFDGRDDGTRVNAFGASGMNDGYFASDWKLSSDEESSKSTGR